MRSAVALIALLGLGLASAGTPALAQGAADYPNAAIKMIVPYPAGGATDIIARLVGAKLTEAWKQPVIVDNKPGASGAIGTNLVAKGPADGHTLLMGITALVQAPALGVKLPYDVLSDLVPLSELARSSNLFVISTAIPAQDLKAFVALAKAAPKKHSYGSYGNGTSSHLFGELLNMAAGIELVHVPYRGSAPLVNDLLGLQLDSAIVDIASVRAHLESGKFRILAATGANRIRFLPEVPTFGELGYAGFEPYGWFGLFARAGTAPEIVARLSAELARIVRLPEISSKLVELGLEPVGSTAEEFAGVIRKDLPIWSKIVKDARITLE